VERERRGGGANAYEKSILRRAFVDHPMSP